MCSTLFLYWHFFAVVFENYKVKLPETSYNVVTRFMEERSYVFSFTFFQCRSFSLALVAASFSRFLTAVTKVSCCSSNNSSSRTLSLFFSLSFAGLPPTFSFPLSFSCSIFQICGHDNCDPPQDFNAKGKSTRTTRFHFKTKEFILTRFSTLAILPH